MLKPSDLIGRQVHGTAAILGALPRTPQTLGAVAQIAALGRPPLAAGGLMRWALVVPAERLGAIGALTERYHAPQVAAAPTIEHHPAPVCVSADHPKRKRAGRRRSRPALH